MKPQHRLSTLILVNATFISGLLIFSTNFLSAQEKELQALGGEWLFVEDRTEGRPVESGVPPMSVKFSLQVKKDGVVYPRPRGDERITLDRSTIEKKNENGSLTRYSGVWKDGALEYTLETIRLSDSKRVLVIKRVFQATAEGLLVNVTLNEGTKQVALYRHPDDIKLPNPAKATIADVKWITGVWSGTRRTSAVEERWMPPKGGAMLGVSSTVRKERMVGFEYLRIVERDGGLVYVAQPGGRPPTEFVLTKLDANRAEFVNPRHDYPQRIVYELSKEGKLTASIGFAKGRLQGMEFTGEGKNAAK